MLRKYLFPVILAALSYVMVLPISGLIHDHPWTWICKEERCVKVHKDELNSSEVGNPVGICKLNCGRYGTLLPHPTGKVELGKGFVNFSQNMLHFAPVVIADTKIQNLTSEAIKIFRLYLEKMNPDHSTKEDALSMHRGPAISSCSSFIVIVNLVISHADWRLTLDTDESYNLSIVKNDEAKATVTIKAPTYFGARHGLETLSQLIGYNDKANCYQMVDQAVVDDRPVYKYRGIVLDTSRNFISTKYLRRLIDGMSYNKLNMFHWHITDSQSFPFYSKSVPLLTKYGAYSRRQIYTIEGMKQLVEYARIRGVKIIVEFDAPAHVGNGWEWGPREGMGHLAVCINRKPWNQYCQEPPCGQLNPVNEHVYEVLEKLYGDMLEIFDDDLFHMGGDEVNVPCWNDTQEIREYMEKHGMGVTHESYIGLWNIFQGKALRILKERSREVSGPRSNLTAILWTSDLVSQSHILEYVDKKDYIIQTWTTGNDPLIPFMLDNDYRVIFSNYDAWYFDCGYGSWIGESRNNWCSPYKGWQEVYANSPFQIYEKARSTEAALKALKNGLLLGGEAAMWTEQVDGAGLDNKIFPRASALAERLWSNPSTTWHEAELRMVHNRQRYAERGSHPDRLQPEWCHQNEKHCKY